MTHSSNKTKKNETQHVPVLILVPLLITMTGWLSMTIYLLRKLKRK